MAGGVTSEKKKQKREKNEKTYFLADNRDESESESESESERRHSRGVF